MTVPLRRAIGSLHDQVGALRGEALNTADTALRLAADAELRAASLTSKLEDSQRDALTVLGRHVASTGLISDNLVKLANLVDQANSGILLPLVHTHHATQQIELEWMTTISAWAAILPMLLQSYDKQTSVKAASTFFEAFRKFSDLMMRAVWIEDIETRKKLSEEAHAIRQECIESITSLLGMSQTIN